ncbi:MAG: anhydro-N-acetylmuramic acid kinase [Bacteroidota bacterium]
MKTFFVIGVMSGTSLDGIDLCYVRFDYTTQWNFEIISTATIPYTNQWKNRLAKAHLQSENSGQKIDIAYTELLAETIIDFRKNHRINRLDFVASHGHTVWHQPEKNFTLQIGNLPELASLIKSKVVCDFRVQDIELGGQGAPLVPIGDELLFSEYTFCLNLGGFANLSTAKQNKRLAFDVCPVNKALNHYANQLGLAYDAEGNIARNSKIDTSLLTALNQLDFYTEKGPKSLGIEWVEKYVFPLINSKKIKAETAIATFTQHVADQISNQFRNLQKSDKVLVTGGGAYNKYLIELMAVQTKAQLVLPDSNLIDFKEALIFAFLGVLRVQNEINVLASVTGASKNHCSGKIYD